MIFLKKKGKGRRLFLLYINSLLESYIVPSTQGVVFTHGFSVSSAKNYLNVYVWVFIHLGIKNSKGSQLLIRKRISDPVLFPFCEISPSKVEESKFESGMGVSERTKELSSQHQSRNEQTCLQKKFALRFICLFQVYGVL